MEILINITILVFSYLLGSIPFGLLITKYAGKGDIRNIGSGNIGATNVMRSGNKKLGYVTFVCDALKGIIPVLIAKLTGSEIIVCFSAILAVLGHIFPVWLKFKGGKGVATAIAAYLGVYWFMGLFMCAVWYGVFKVSRISSLSSVISITLTNVISLYFIDGYKVFLMTIIISAIIVYKHKDNIIRILRSEEASF